jgi:tetratricopeptide (TPR) repeat protein
LRCPNILIVSDDLDLPLGTLRLRQSGGAGGQRGVRNIIQHLGTNEFDRVRFGIGRPPGKMDPAAYVLQDFQGDDQILAQEVVDQAASAVEVWLREGIEAAMTRYNGDVRAAQDTSLQVDPEAELAKFQRAHELAPNDPGPIDRIIGILKRLGRVAEAADWHLKAAELFEARGKAEKAITQRERAASLQPQRLDLHRQIAAAYLETGNKRKAVQRLLSLAAYLDAHNRPDEALAAVAEALVINPEHPKGLAMAEKLRTRQPD